MADGSASSRLASPQAAPSGRDWPATVVELRTALAYDARSTSRVILDAIRNLEHEVAGDGSLAHDGRPIGRHCN